jgi:hypothetical protein
MKGNMERLTLDQVYALCEESKAKGCRVLFRCMISDKTDALSDNSSEPEPVKWDLIGISSDYLWNTGSPPANTVSLREFAGVYLSVLGIHGRDRTDTFLIDSGSFLQGEYQKRKEREATIVKASRNDLLLYMDSQINPELFTKIFNGQIPVL